MRTFLDLRKYNNLERERNIGDDFGAVFLVALQLRTFMHVSNIISLCGPLKKEIVPEWCVRRLLNVSATCATEYREWN
jgi:hypothetical protein